MGLMGLVGSRATALEPQQPALRGNPITSLLLALAGAVNMPAQRTARQYA